MHRLEADSILLSINGRSILSDIYLQCDTGSITGLLGRNGEGKSCLMKVIYGTLPCEKSVRIDKCVVYGGVKSPYLLHYLPQFYFIPKSLTIKQLFWYFQLHFDHFQRWFPEYGSAYKKKIGSLSGGGQRLVETYAMIMAESCFALLDEPFTHLSPLQTEKVKELIVAEKPRKGFLITDHMYRHILEMQNRLYVLKNGKTHLVSDMHDLETLGYARMK